MREDPIAEAAAAVGGLMLEGAAIALSIIGVMLALALAWALYPSILEKLRRKDKRKSVAAPR